MLRERMRVVVLPPRGRRTASAKHLASPRPGVGAARCGAIVSAADDRTVSATRSCNGWTMARQSILVDRRHDFPGYPKLRPMNAKFKHLEFIQGVVNRLATDSFLLKGWSVTLVAALFVLLARSGRLEFAHVSLVPVVTFWGLDGYFLWQERLFRALYDHVRALEESDIDFSMDITRFQQGRRRTWFGATFSRTLIGFHGALALMVGIAICLD